MQIRVRRTLVGGGRSVRPDVKVRGENTHRISCTLFTNLPPSFFCVYSIIFFSVNNGKRERPLRFKRCSLVARRAQIQISRITHNEIQPSRLIFDALVPEIDAGYTYKIEVYFYRRSATLYSARKNESFRASQVCKEANTPERR